MSLSKPTISVIIPVKNEGLKIRACIEGILNQSVRVAEIIVIDSGSTDDTVKILKEYDLVKLIEIPGNQFNHGSTRMLGVKHAVGEFCLLTVGDARAYDKDWIKNLLNGFTDEKVAGVCGQQVVAHDLGNNPVEWFRPQSDPELIYHYFETADKFKALDSIEKRRVCGWDDVNAMYRRSVLLDIPFRHVTFAEDALWAMDALLAGHAIVYNYAARVYHYHLEFPEFTFKRKFTVYYHFYKFFGYKPMLTPGDAYFHLRVAKILFKEKALKNKEKWAWWKYNLALRKGTKKAVRTFYATIKNGDSELDALHESICGTPPIPMKS